MAAQHPGRLGNYRIVKTLGQGGMGTVYLAEQTGLERQVALKTLRPQLAKSESASKRFLREGQSAAQLEHDHIVRVYDAGMEEGIPFIVMELLQGEPLDGRLKRKPELSLVGVLKIGYETALGLHAAHEIGVIHRDIKPGNLWLELGKDETYGFKRVKIVDFGLARPIDAEETELTDAGVVLGTPAFMSPEQSRGEPLDHRSDLFSLGITLYLLSTGQLPFRGKSIGSVAVSLANDKPRPADDHNSELPARFADLIQRLLSKTPNDRPATARDVANELQEIEKAMLPSAVPIAMPVLSPSILRSLEDPFGDLESHAIQTKLAAGPTDSMPPQRTPKKRWLIAGAVAVLVLLAVAVLSRVMIEPAEMPRGTLIVKSETPNVRVLVDDKQVTLRSKNHKIDLPVGNHTIEIVDQQTGLLLSTNKFTIEANREELVRVYLKKPSTVREVAEAVLALKGTLSYLIDKKLVTVKAADDLPSEESPLVGISFSTNTQRIGDEDLEMLPILPELKSLTVENHQRVTSAGMKHLAKLTSLTLLRLGGTSVDDDGLKVLSALPKLQELTLTKTKVTDEGLCHLPKLKELQILSLFGTTVTDGGLTPLGKLKKLTVLNLKATKVTEGNLRRLHTLLPDCTLISDFGTWPPEK